MRTPPPSLTFLSPLRFWTLTVSYRQLELNNDQQLRLEQETQTQMERLWSNVREIRAEVVECKDELHGLRQDFKRFSDESSQRLLNTDLDAKALRTNNDIASAKLAELESVTIKLRMDFGDMTSKLNETIDMASADSRTRNTKTSEMICSFANKIDTMDQVSAEEEEKVGRVVTKI